MRRVVKVKTPASHVPLRKAAMSASAASRRAFPAWIADDESGIAFPARAAAMPRVRDALVLRTVSRKKSSSTKGSSHGDGMR
jgi:hypothetical protein